MDTSKVIRGVVNSGRYTVTAPIVKEDYGLKLKIDGVELPSTYQVDFSNSEHSGTSVTMIGNSDGVLIPHQFIDTGKDVFAFLYHVGANYGRTVYKFRIPNKVRPDRTDDTPTPEQASVIDQAIGALNTAVEQTAQDVIDADASAQSAQGYAEQAESARDTAQGYASNAQLSATQANNSAISANQSASASAQSASQAEQIKSDVEDLADDAQGYAQASAQSASASANSASQAQGYAQSASASAQSASGYASQADISANTASNKASEASTSAQTASQKATESAQSASQALSYKTDAESAKTASQTAQGKAEDAQTAAETAQGKAEDAQEAAETAAASIQSSAAQIATNTTDILKAFPTDSASGATASFSDGADGLPLKSLIVNIDPVQDLSNGDPSPENLCPITGWEGCEVNATGYNVWDEQWESGGYAYGNPSSDSSRIRNKNYIPVVPNTTYFFKKGLNNGNMWVFFYDRNKVCLNRTVNGNNVDNTSGIVTTPDKCYYVNFFLSAQTEYQHDVTINYPSADHDYHPYQGRTITISLGQTVFGAKLDMLSGVMRIEWADIDLATLSGWVNNMGGQNAIEIRCTLTGKKGGRTNIISNMLKTGTETSATDTAVFSIRGYPTSSTIAVKVPKTVAQDSSEVVTWIANNHPMVCYELAEPIEIQLTPHEVNSLLGVNNIFANTGDCSVEYRADTKLYIERLTAPDSADMIADANITSGQYFMVGNSLYKATANIANGGQIIVGTNATRVSLAQALNEINV